MSDTAPAYAALGHRILSDAVVAGGPEGLNAAGHRVIHALLSGQPAAAGAVDEGGPALAGRLVFGVIRTVPLPPSPAYPAWLHSVLLIAVMPDKNWRRPLKERTLTAEPWLCNGGFTMRAWKLAVGDRGSPQEALRGFMGNGARWSRRLQAILDDATDTDAHLVAWLEAHAKGRSASAPRHR